MMTAARTSEPTAAVIGAGTMGVTLAHVISSTGRPCKLWCSDRTVVDMINNERRDGRFFANVVLSDSLLATTSMAEAVRSADVVIVASASKVFRAVAAELGEVARPEQLLLSATKGLEPASAVRLTEVLESCTTARAVGAIGGANITFDIMANQLTTLLVAARLPEARELGVAVLCARQVEVRVTEDVIGMEYVSALKNVAAIAVGMATGLGLGINTQSLVLTRAYAEVGLLNAALGGTSAMLLDVCGIGDLYLTCTHHSSLNRRLGVELGAGRSLAEILSDISEVPEGINSVAAAVELARRHGLQTPITSCVHAIIGGRVPASTLQAVVARA